MRIILKITSTRVKAVLLVTALVAAAPASARAQQRDQARWSAVAAGIGRPGKTEDGYYRVEFPRTDLSVAIGEHKLAPAFELTSYFAFVPTEASDVLTMGELVLRDDEVNAVMDEARKQGVDVAALHNHLIGEAPRLMYAHVMMKGSATHVAQALRALLARTATPVGAAADQPKGDKSTWAAVSASLGQPNELAATTAEWEFARHEAITERGVSVKSSGALETASEVVFQHLANDRAATTGELFLNESEITPVSNALESGGIHVTAIHMHMVHETPRLYWLHWYGVGEPSALAKTISAALEHTNGDRKTKP